MLFYWPMLLYPNYSLLLSVSLSLLSVNRLVLCGWGLRTDRMYITLSALHCRPFLIIIIIKLELLLKCWFQHLNMGTKRKKNERDFKKSEAVYMERNEERTK